MRRTLEERFWAKVNKNGPGGCWDWTGCKAGRGYGYFYAGKKMKYAHRTSWELHNGPIPKGLCVLHKCDRPACVNPSCLFLGTQADNMKDKAEKGRQYKGSGHWNSKLNESQAALIKNFFARHSGFGSGAFLARWFGVEQKAISNIKRGINWNHLKEGI